jgi:hypothetical protein
MSGSDTNPELPIIGTNTHKAFFKHDFHTPKSQLPIQSQMGLFLPQTYKTLNPKTLKP